MDLENLDQGLYRLKIPFMSVTTTVYFYICEQGAAIIDSATYPSDVDNYILPALDALEINRETVKMILQTHGHEDHAGGLQRLAQALPHAAVRTSFDTDLPNQKPLRDGEMVLGNLKSVFLPGHTYDSYGFFDTATKTLLSGDCLQLAGIGCYRNNYTDLGLYVDSIHKLQQMDIRRIVAAHEFDPLGSLAEGVPAVENYLNQCIQIIQRS